MTQFSAECLYCDHKMRTATEAEHHTCEQNTLTDKIDTLRAQNAELLAALEAGHEDLRARLIQHAQSAFGADYDQAATYADCAVPVLRQMRAAIAKAKEQS